LRVQPDGLARHGACRASAAPSGPRANRALGIMTTARILLALGAVAAIVACIGCHCSHPADEELIRSFEQHRGEFEQLREMLASDTLLYQVWPNQVWGYEGAASP